MNKNLLIFLIFNLFSLFEFGCLKSYHECSINDPFKCIPETWVCDGNDDCEDGSDELNCSELICEKDQFKCLNSDQCLSKELLCDDNRDCLDNSDEFNCTVLKKTCNERTEYDCRNSKDLECIPLENVCNKKYNCSTKRNLNEDCNFNMCINETYCSHTCVNKYSSFVCDCPNGMILDIDKKTCKPFNMCLETPNICSQICIDTKIGYQCKCYDGYIQRGSQCELQSFDKAIYILYSSYNRIYSIPIFELDYENPQLKKRTVNSQYNILSFDVKLDTSDKMTIYSSLIEKENVLAINNLKSMQNNSNNKMHMKNNLMEIKLENFTLCSTALDPDRNLLFFTDLKSRSISVMNLTSLDKLKIIDKDCYYPISLVIDPVNSNLFWIDLGEKDIGPKIKMCNMDGSYVKTLLEVGLHKPSSLAIDIDDQKLYWTEHFPPSIYYIDLKLLKNRSIKPILVLEKMLIEPISIAIFGNRLYWSDWKQNRIYSAHKLSGKEVKMIIKCNKSKTIKIISKEFNQKLIEKTYLHPTSKSCSGLNNNCPYSCLPNAISPQNPRCFGSGPERKKNHQILWLILIPVVLVVCFVIFIIKYRHLKSDNNVSRTTGNVYIYDNVRFFEDDRSSIQNENQIVSDSLPIINYSD